MQDVDSGRIEEFNRLLAVKLPNGKWQVSLRRTGSDGYRVRVGEDFMTVLLETIKPLEQLSDDDCYGGVL